jgi:hypothetical protein
LFLNLTVTGIPFEVASTIPLRRKGGRREKGGREKGGREKKKVRHYQNDRLLLLEAHSQLDGDGDPLRGLRGGLHYTLEPVEVSKQGTAHSLVAHKIDRATYI